MQEDNHSIGQLLGLVIKDARRKAKLKQQDVAQIAKTFTSVTLSRIESGGVRARDATLRQIALALGLQENEFIDIRKKLANERSQLPNPYNLASVVPAWNLEAGGGALTEIYPSDESLFDLQSLKAEINDKLANYSELENKFRIKLGNFEDLALRLRSLPPLQEQPAIWAQMTRAHFRVGPESPLVNLVQVLEQNGVRIVFTYRLGEETTKTFFENTPFRPVIALNRGHTSERLLNNLAKEVALVCTWLRNGCKVLQSRAAHDKSAQAFAAELLMPQACVRDLMWLLNMGKDDWTLPIICQAKIRFGVSALMFNHRLEELKAIDPELSRSIHAEIRAKYDRTEPEPRLPPEPLQQESWLALLRARAY